MHFRAGAFKRHSSGLLGSGSAMAVSTTLTTWCEDNSNHFQSMNDILKTRCDRLGTGVAVSTATTGTTATHFAMYAYTRL